MSSEESHLRLTNNSNDLYLQQTGSNLDMENHNKKQVISENTSSTPIQFHKEGTNLTLQLPTFIISDSSPQKFDTSNSVDNLPNLLEPDNNNEPQLSPQRSCDSAYGSSMESNVHSNAEDAVEGVNFDQNNVTGNKDLVGVTASQIKSLWLQPVAKGGVNKSSQSSSCSSPASEGNFDYGNNNTPATGDGSAGKSNLVLDRQAFLRKLSSASKYSLRSSLSIESEDDLISSDDGCFSNNKGKNSPVKTTRTSSWTKLRRMVIWSPFMQSFKKNYPWVQLAGHTGNFQPGQEGCILKKYVKGEADFLKLMSEDPQVQGLAPTFHGVVDNSGHKYTRMQDLLLTFDAPSIMDCKMGVRTYLEDELAKAKNNPNLRPDMYNKMVEISPEAPTPEEHQQKAVTKPRYMQWRELVSSTSNLGFRIEGIKKANKEPSKDYKLTKTKNQVTAAFEYFIDGNKDVLEKYIERLEEMRTKLTESELFHQHEVIGSSLLFVHDETSLAGAWMIDFGKTTKLPDGMRNNHRTEWIEGNREDGYLFGMDNLIKIFQDLHMKLCAEEEDQCCTDVEKSSL